MTNVVGFDSRASIGRQAREWLIRLDGDAPLSGEEQAALREWLSRSPLHREELTRLARFWNSANVLTELAVPLERAVDARRDDARSQLRAKPYARQRTRIFAAAAGVLFASVIAGFWWWTNKTPLRANGIYGTAIGQQQALSLPDGSSIQLNTDSQVEVRYSSGLRKIRLLRGEALFAVTHDASRPFDVYAANGIVRAIGTAFAVRLAGGDVNVTVTTGTVEVSEVAAEAAAPATHGSTEVRRARARVTAGQMVNLHAAGSTVAVRELPPPELQRRMAWHEGYLVFSGEPLSAMVEEVNRYSPVTLRIADPKLASLAVGGRFRIGDLDAELDVLRENFGIQSVRDDDRNIRLEPAPPR
jgi:transmembrane sensor